MATSMEDDFKFTLEVHFAQRLAGNFPKARERTVKKLKRWISARSTKQGDVGMEEELLRLWKGLFYCMWMCDKPLVQEELADKIADLIHSFSTPLGAINFFDAFLLTMKREWLGIDRLRMDKFFMFIRRCFRQALVVLRNNNWEESVVDRFLEVLCKTPLCGISDASSDGLCYHFIDIYKDELALCAGNELTPEQVLKLIDPFCVLVTTAHSKTLMKVTLRGFFQEIIDESDVGFPVESDDEDEGIDSGEDEKGDGVPDEAEENNDDETNEKEMKPVRKELPKLKYNYAAIADRLFALASKESTPGPYRRKVYAMVKKFRDLKEGVFPDYNVASLLNYQEDGPEFIYGDRPWLKNLDMERDGIQGKKRKASKEVARGDDEDGDEEPKRKRRRRRKRKQVKKSAATEDEKATGIEEMSQASTDSKASTGEEVTDKKQKKKKRISDDDQVVQEDIQKTSDEDVEEMSETSTTKQAGDVTADTADTKESAGEEVTVKKQKKKKRKSNGDQVVQKDIQKTTDEEDSKMGALETKESCETVGVDLEESPEKSTKKRRKRKSKSNLPETTESDKTPEKSPEKTEKPETAEPELLVNLEKPQSQKKRKQPKPEKPFAAFQRTSTPPAFVRRSVARKDTEPQSEPPSRKGILLTDDTDSDQATPKKRVKIVLGLNKAHASKDYQIQLQSSPGIPFDGSKQPTQSVLKTPSPKQRQFTGKKTKASPYQTPSPAPRPSAGKKQPTPGSGKKQSPKEKIMALRRSLRLNRIKKQK
ncbi:uncharacterized protein [Asterias amurensis]|uniref:uncharacterized protein n=1 Tax=Asterias amurensis TaxID=7602 RepID=UPI003AB81F97